MKRILVIGGGGFIGSHLVRQLLLSNYHITVIDFYRTDTFIEVVQNAEDVTYLEMDLVDAIDNGTINFDKFDVIYHLAGTSFVPATIVNPQVDFNLNIQSTFKLLSALRLLSNPPKVIYTSSAAVYGNPLRMPISETDATKPISPYGVSKLSAERYMYVFNHIYGIPTTSIRIFSVYGPWLQKQVVFDLFSKLKRDPENIDIFGTGIQERDFLYIEDVVKALILVEEKAAMDGDVYNLASGSSITINQLLDNITGIMGLNPNVQYGDPRPGDPEKWTVNIDKIVELGFISHFPIEKGLDLTYQWIQGYCD